MLRYLASPRVGAQPVQQQNWLARPLGRLTALTALDLGNNRIGADGTCALAEPLARLTALALRHA